MSEKIRIKHSGLIVFSSKIFSVLTGLIFTVVVTRNLSVNDFGIWQYLSLILSYAVFPATLIPYWATRFYARGAHVAKTTILSNMILSTPSFLIFLILAPLTSTVINVNLSLFHLISFQIFLVYLSTSLEALALAKQPHLIGYETISFEVTKIVLALLLFLTLNLKLENLIIIVILAYLAQCLTLIFFLRKDFMDEKERFDWVTQKKWFFNIWLPLFNSFPGFIGGLDLFVLAVLTKSTFSLAFYKVAYSIATVISYSLSTTIALYPNLLKGGGRKDIEETLNFFLIFAVPITFGAVFLAKPILHIFKHEYEEASILLIFMAPQFLLKSLIHIFGDVIIGMEKVDMQENASFKAFLKSKLFKWPLLNYIRNIIAVALTFIFLMSTTLRLNIINDFSLYAAFNCLLANIIADFFLFIKSYLISIKTIKFVFPLNKLFKYCFASIVMVIMLKILNPNKSIETLFTVCIGAIVYFICLFLIDFESRILFKRIFTYIKSKGKLWE
ncbi:MAG: hypothetical protein QXL69_04300 [Candidatus Bathyarchaeia archaeon]